MKNISEIKLERNGITIWTIGSDDFWIDKEDFGELIKAIINHRKKYKKKKRNYARISFWANKRITKPVKVDFSKSFLRRYDEAKKKSKKGERR